MALHVVEGREVVLLLLQQGGAVVVDRIGHREDLGALLGPAHAAQHQVDLALLGGLDGARPFHLLRFDLKAEPFGELGDQLAVGADQLAVLEAGHRHVAVEADGELAGRDRLGRVGQRNAAAKPATAPAMQKS